MNALIVEDESSFREVVRHVLEPLGIHFLEAGTLGEGLEIASLHKDIDLIILDLRLTDSDADTTIKHIPNFRKMHSQAGLLIMTGLVDEALEERCLEQGADYFASKSSIATSGALCAAVLKCMEHHRDLHPAQRIEKSVELLRRTVSSLIENN